MFDRITFDPKVMGGRACVTPKLIEVVSRRKDDLISGMLIIVEDTVTG